MKEGGADFSRIGKSELLALLGQGHCARVTVVTPNHRLAAALRRDFDSQQERQGLTRWEAADILPLSALLERLHGDALYSELAPAIPALLSDAQEQSLWEDVVGGSEAGVSLLSVPGAAALAREAWRLVQAWRLAPRLKDYPVNDDARAFAGWARRFEGRCTRERYCDRATLADVVAPHLAHAALRRPATLVAYAFDMPTMQQRELFVAFACAGVRLHVCGPEEHRSEVRRLAFASADDERRAAACWARTRLEEWNARMSPPAPHDRAEGRSFDGAEAPSPAPASGTQVAAGAGPMRPPRIGIVVPDLAQSRKAVQRALTQVMAPAHLLDAGGAKVLPFNLSLGEPLLERPLVAAALLVLDLARTATAGELDFPQASRLIRSPFIGGAQAECAARALLDARLRVVVAPGISLRSLLAEIGRLASPRRVDRGDEAAPHGPAATPSRPGGAAYCPILVRHLTRLAGAVRDHGSGARRPSEWARIFQDLLEAAGFPGDRGRDSVEFQTLEKLRQTIADFAALDRVAGRMHFSGACARLSRMAADILFQPETPPVPVQVLGVLESTGLEFDHLWVCGLTDEAWPIPARPHPFLPVALQRAAGVPESSALNSLALDRRITRGWRNAADEVVLSHALREGDRELAPSALITGIPLAELCDGDTAQTPAASDPGAPDALRLPRYESLRDVLHGARREERLTDLRAPALQEGSLARGGAGVFRDQAACPFRACALHRLGARGLGAPVPGLDAAARGTLLHALFASIWQELGSRARLDALDQAGCDALLARAVDHAVGRLRGQRPDALGRRHGMLERARLAGLARAWLDLERQRAPFEVLQTEAQHALCFGGVTVHARFDRVDRLEDGSLAVLDYKTGAASVGDWLGPRPGDPQIPLYVLGLCVEGAAPPGAAAYACVKAGAMAFKGLARAEGRIPGVGTIDRQRGTAARGYGSWGGLLEGWRVELDALGRSFAAGEAQVDPRRGEQTCRHCELQPLCRINERLRFLGSDAEDYDTDVEVADGSDARFHGGDA